MKNTGRCRELLIPGAEIFVQDAGPGFLKSRRTRYDLISVRKGGRLVNIDSAAPNKVFAEWVRAGGLFRDVTEIRPEYGYGGVRFDFYIETAGRRILAEIKGVTLEEDGAALFPDAPTRRGVRHLQELISAVRSGYDAYAVFVVQMKGVRYMAPNWSTHAAFGDALAAAERAGVKILAVDCNVTETAIAAADLVEVRIEG